MASSGSGSGPGPFDRFLLWLSPDRNLGAQEYEKIKKNLTRYFTIKGCPAVDRGKLVDDTFDRVLQLEDRWRDNPLAFCIRVAGYIWLEYKKRPRPESLGDRDFPIPPSPDPEREPKLKCLEKCLAELPEDERELITRFYQSRGRERIDIRKQLATEHGGSSNLRVRAFRIRRKLAACITACLQAKIN